MDAERLKKIDLFSSLDDSELDDIASTASETSIDEGETMIGKGGSSYQLFAIEDGEVEVQREGDTLATLKTGDVVGEHGVLERALRNADVVAKTDVKAIYFTQDQVKQMRKSLPDFDEKLERLFEERSS